MSDVGKQLRAAREARKLDVYQVAELTKIKTDHIRALEEGNWDAFTAPVYIRGFVRCYVRLLKLDEPRVMAALDAELSQTKKFCEPPRLDPHKRGILDFLMLQLIRVNWRVALPVMALVVVASGSVWGYNRWRQLKNTDPLSKLGPGIYQSPAGSPGEFLPLPTNAPQRK